MPAEASIHIQPKDLMERWQLPSYTSENYKNPTVGLCAARGIGWPRQQIT